MATFLRFVAALLLALTGVAPPATAGHPAPVADPRAERVGAYRHLGAVTSDGGYAGVTGVFTVTDPGVRPRSTDFVAARFLALGRSGGRDQWLEVGWTEDGWRDDAQYVYTFDTVELTWRYYPRYAVAPGDRVALALTAGDTGPHGTPWSAWLRWDGRWTLLTTRTLPVDDRATIEQYVEVYVDPARGGTYAVPPVAVSGVELRPTPTAPYLPWLGAAVPTAESPAYDGYQVTWRSRHNTWTAGTSRAP